MPREYAVGWIMRDLPASPQFVLYASIVALGCISWSIYRLAFAPLSKLPGPWYTNLSCLVLVYHEFTGSKRLWTHRLHLKYGPVVRLAPNAVSFASTTAVKEIYTAAGGYDKTELYSLFEPDGHGNLFTALDKKLHNEKKRRLTDRYTNTAVLQDGVQRVLRERAEAFARVCSQQGLVDVYLYLHCYALDCVSAMVFDPYGTKSIDSGKANEMVQLLSYHNMRPGLVLRHYYPRLEVIFRTVRREPLMGGQMISEYAWLSIGKSSHSAFTLARCLLDHPEMSMGDRVSECLDHIVAGIDTTGDALCFLMWELSQPHNRKRMQRLCEETRSCGSANAADLSNLPYMHAMIEETMRLWAPGTLPLLRYVPDTGRVIDGFFLPARTVVGIQSYTLHRLDEAVFPQPSDFIPERWLEENGKAERQRHMFGFGAGARTCIGRHLALSEMRMLLHTVYSRFRTRPADDMRACMMEMSDQLLSSRPKDLLCKLIFEPLS